MPMISDYVRRRKLDHFFGMIDRSERILEVGTGDGWLREWCREHGYHGYVGLDLGPPADIIGDIREWRELGIEPGSFDVVVAFEVVEHVDCFQECYDILREGGRMMITTPVPRMDWLLRVLELLGLNQPRVTPHDNLLDLRGVEQFEHKEIRTIYGLTQWAVFEKHPGD